MKTQKQISSQPTLREVLHACIKRKNYSEATEESYYGWMRRLYLFYKPRPLRELGTQEVEAFLTHLAVKERVSSSSQWQALHALIFLYRELYKTPLALRLEFGRSQKPKHLPTVLTHHEATAILSKMRGTPHLVCSLLYGAGLRISEGISLRVKDIDFEAGNIHIHQAKGRKDRYVPLPDATRDELLTQREYVLRLHEADLAAGLGWVELPDALARKYPTARYDLIWQWFFPAYKRSRHPATHQLGRWHIFPDSVQRAFKAAARQARVFKRVTCHTLRHSYATYLYRQGVGMRDIQEMLGHKSIKTTQIYTHIIAADGRSIRSPLDQV